MITPLKEDLWSPGDLPVPRCGHRSNTVKCLKCQHVPNSSRIVFLLFSNNWFTHLTQDYYIIIYYIILYHIILYHIMLYYIILYYITLHYIILYYCISYYIILYHITSYYIIFYHIISYYIINIYEFGSLIISHSGSISWSTAATYTSLPSLALRRFTQQQLTADMQHMQLGFVPRCRETLKSHG